MSAHSVNGGQVVASGTVDELRGRARQRVEVWFREEPPTAELAAIPGLERQLVEGRRFAAVLTGPIQPLLEVLAHHPVVNVLVEEPDLEEAFLDLYEGAS